MSEAQTTAPIDLAAAAAAQERYEAQRARIRDATQAAWEASGLAQAETGEVGNG